MSNKRNKLVIRDDHKRIASALWDWEQPRDDFGYPMVKPDELPDVVGETIQSAKAYGLSFEGYGTSYEYVIDGPVLLKMDSGRVFSLFGESLYEVKKGRRSGYLAYLRNRFSDNYMPEAEVQKAFRKLRKHTILNAYYDERGILEIDLDNCLSIESADGCAHEYSHIYLHQRLR